MGTRNCTIVRYKGENKIAQYCQWDGFFENQGRDILEFLHEVDLEVFKEKLEEVRFINGKEEHDKIVYERTGIDLSGRNFIGFDESRIIESEVPELHRAIGAKKILDLVYTGRAKVLHDFSDFIYDRIFCEFYYIIDLDEGTFGSYKNYLTGDHKKDTHEKGYEVGVKYDLNELPSEQEYLDFTSNLLQK